MVARLYDLILLVCAALLIPWYLVRRLLRLKARAGLRERFASYPPGRLSGLAERPTIWVHAVSVGETRAAIPLIKGLRSAYPGHALLITNMTETGHAVASTMPEVDLCLYFPYDLSWVMRRAIDAISPSLIVIVETEIWPNLVTVAARYNIPVMLVNGRISDRSFPRYLRFKRVLAPILSSIQAFCMQSETDAERIAQLGAQRGSIVSTGNLKFDMPTGLEPGSERDALRESYRLDSSLPLLVAGSTHDGEEAAVLQAYQGLLGAGRRLGLILAPRHPERVAEVEELLRRCGLVWRRRSMLTAETGLLDSGEVLLVDTLGELLALYAAGDIVFVGGSLVAVGGHNILEAALVGKPVIFGPYMQNFREISRLVLQAGAGFSVDSADELRTVIAKLFDRPEVADQAGESGLRLIAAHRGATERTMAVARRLLER